MDQSNVTVLLRRLSSGDRSVEPQLFELVFQELQHMARSFMRRERADHTLQPTALVNEAYIRLAGCAGDWKSRAHFFWVAAITMRKILIDYARQHGSEKRGSGAPKVELDESLLGRAVDLDGLIAVDEALERLALFDARLAKVVEMRYFAGLTEEEIGLLLDLSPRTVKRDWAVAKKWLQAESRPVTRNATCK